VISATIKDRAVTILADPLRRDAEGVTYLLETSDVLFILSGSPLSRDVSVPITSVLLAVAALP